MFIYGVWSSLVDLRDLSLRDLASKLETTMIASIADGTTDPQRRALLRWKSFASSRVEIQAFPVTPEHVALYLQYLMDTTFSYSLVDVAFYAT